METQKPGPSREMIRVTALAALGQRIRAERKAQGLRIDDAAALCGVSVDTLSRLENGHHGISTVRLLKVLQGLGLALFVGSVADAPLSGGAAPRDDR